MKRHNFFKMMRASALLMGIGNELHAAEELSEKDYIPDNTGYKRYSDNSGEALQNSAVRTYNYSPDVHLSQRYTMKAGKLPILVMDVPSPSRSAAFAAFTAFETDGQVDIEIECTIDIKWVDVRPLKADVNPKIVAGKIIITIPTPGNYSVEINGKLDYPLFIFANPKEVRPSRSDSNVIFFDAGKVHKPGVIHPKSNQHVFIEGGAVVIGAISAAEVENVKVSGYGVLDGSYNNPQRITDGLVKPWLPEQGYTIADRHSWFVAINEYSSARSIGWRRL